MSWLVKVDTTNKQYAGRIRGTGVFLGVVGELDRTDGEKVGKRGKRGEKSNPHLISGVAERI